MFYGDYKSASGGVEPRAALRAKQCRRAVITTLAAMFLSPVHADPQPNYPNAGHSAFEIWTSALGLERYTQYSADQNALGIAWAKNFGVEASYINLGESKFAKQRNDNVGGRLNLKLAMDISASLGERTRIYSRAGMYLWELDINYNRTTNTLDASREGNSRMAGVGVVYGTDPLRIGIELEQVNAVSFDDPRDQQRVIFNMVSKF
ncbi:MAG: hypothetical protein HY273_14160 [Gammaproteobacteria bacterium]|nr:hypothetical protein [Gammaproteobacteria bacterium]